MLKWHSVPHFDDFYEVSNKGIVKSLDRYVITRSGAKRFIEGRILKPRSNNYNYLYVRLSKNGITTSVYLHRLLATVFIPNTDGKKYVNHKDGNPQNNNVENLEWVTHAENVQHGYDIGLNSNQGGSHPLAVGVVDNILGQGFKTIKEWCEARNIKYSTGRNLISGCNKSRTIDLSAIVILKKINRENG